MEEYQVYYVLVLESVNIGQEWYLAFEFEKGVGRKRLKMNTSAVQRIFGSISAMNDLIVNGTPKPIAFDKDGQIMMANVTLSRKPDFSKHEEPEKKEMPPSAEMVDLPILRGRAIAKPATDQDKQDKTITEPIMPDGKEVSKKD